VGAGAAIETRSMPITLGVVTEAAVGERRVALDPDAVIRLKKSGADVLVQPGAGVAAGFPDTLYTDAGATLAGRNAVIDGCSVLAVIGMPEAAVTDRLRSGQAIVGLLDPLNRLDDIRSLATQGVTAVAFELLPRTLSRAQSMDALSSQASAAGYRAGIVAAETFGRYLPMMITASGTAKPAKVIVIGTGVAGLQAIATTRRLGAVVTGYDVRTASRGEVESLGAQFLTSSVATGAGEGGYARPMTPDEQKVQQAELAAALVDFDIIITTARVPGHVPPVLVSDATVASLKPGSVCIDLGASERGGNVAGSVADETVLTAGGVTIVGAGDLARDLPTSASQMYGRNVVAVVASLTKDGEIVIDPLDDVHKKIVVTHDGEVTNVAVLAALAALTEKEAATR
jgi:NAD(P) transhydrogenase subunit alpha